MSNKYATLLTNIAKPVKWRAKEDTPSGNNPSGYVMTWAYNIEEADRMDKMSWQELKAYLTERDGEEPLVCDGELESNPTP